MKIMVVMISTEMRLKPPKEDFLVNRNHDTCFHSGSGQRGIAFTAVN